MGIHVKKNKPEFVDERGFISRLIQSKKGIKSVLYITRKKGSVSANHYHKKDSHYIFCLSGKVRYSEKDIRNPRAKIESVILRPGDLVLSKPLIAHATEFLEDTVLLAFTSEERGQKKYEDDTVRVTIFKSTKNAQ